MMQTSLSAYQKINQDGTRITDKLLVLRAIQRHGAPTDREIAQYLGWHYPKFRHNPEAARKRRVDLVKDGVVMPVGTYQCSVTGEDATRWTTIFKEVKV